jgi:hypothetical protein
MKRINRNVGRFEAPLLRWIIQEGWWHLFLVGILLVQYRLEYMCLRPVKCLGHRRQKTVQDAVLLRNDPLLKLKRKR